ncbi:ribose 5-phosphate isomerase B [Marinilabiliaceae bacterium ANBcel2]|nr:ribose 5-phosphate isomerase B [Marinilabiliaceae bacterium ANBcel2]
MTQKTVAIGCDHAGYELKLIIIKFLNDNGYKVIDFGANSSDSVDYPDYAHPLAISIENGDADLGITICGSGNGISMTVNKHQGIRSALCWMPEISRLARAHNDANVCSLPARFINYNEAILIVKNFLNTKFDGGRHISRINKIPINC